MMIKMIIKISKRIKNTVDVDLFPFSPRGSGGCSDAVLAHHELSGKCGKAISPVSNSNRIADGFDYDTKDCSTSPLGLGFGEGGADSFGCDIDDCNTLPLGVGLGVADDSFDCDTVDCNAFKNNAFDNSSNLCVLDSSLLSEDFDFNILSEDFRFSRFFPGFGLCNVTLEAFGDHFGRLGANLSQRSAILRHLGATLGPP